MPTIMPLPALLALVASITTLLDLHVASSVPTSVQPWRSARFVPPANTLTLIPQAACFAQRTIIKQIRPQTTLPYRDALLAPLVPTQLVQVRSSASKRSPAYLASTSPTRARWAKVDAVTARRRTFSQRRSSRHVKNVAAENIRTRRPSLSARTVRQADTSHTAKWRPVLNVVQANTVGRKPESARTVVRDQSLLVTMVRSYLLLVCSVLAV